MIAREVVMVNIYKIIIVNHHYLDETNTKEK